MAKSAELNLKTEGLSIIRNPFEFDCIDNVMIFARRSIFEDKKWIYHAKVEFENGKTEGTQNFEGNSLGDVILKVEGFIKDLEGKNA